MLISRKAYSLCASRSLSESHCACVFVKCLSVFVSYICEPSLAKKKLLSQKNGSVFSHLYTACLRKSRNDGALINQAVSHFVLNRQLQEKHILRVPSFPSLHSSSLHSRCEMNTNSIVSENSSRCSLSKCKQIKIHVHKFFSQSTALFN